MMSSYMNSSGSCYLPQLPPLPPPPFANQIQPNYWPPFNGSPFLPPPPPAAVPHGHHSYQAGGTVSLLPSPLYGNSKAATYRGKGRRGNGGSGKWKIQKCETCDRVYKSEETFAEHMQSHVKCSQCDFTALPKKVKEHSQVHSLPDFLDFSSPDDIRKWREERKRNYPSVSNVAKKKKLEEQRKMRGQMVDTPLYRYVNQLIGDYDSRCRGRGRGRFRGRGRGNHRGRGHYRQDHQSTEFTKNEQSRSPENDSSSSPPIVNSSDNNDHTLLTDSTIDSHTHSDIDNTCNNGNSDDTPVISDIQTPSNNASSSDTRVDNIGRQERNKCQRSSKQSNGHRNMSSPGRKRQSKQHHCHWSQLPVSKRPTLLEKLLVSSIKSEHNAILQCVRYTVQNDFFDNKSQSPADLNEHSHNEHI